MNITTVTSCHATIAPVATMSVVTQAGACGMDIRTSSRHEPVSAMAALMHRGRPGSLGEIAWPVRTLSDPHAAQPQATARRPCG